MNYREGDMREIKFRAYSIVNRKIWDVRSILEPRYICPDGSVLLARENNPSDDGEVDINLVELMQYTGLKDKNGKEIYEGDILDGLWECYWIDIKAMFAFRKFNNIAAMCGQEFSTTREIIGNIYEHPQLLG